MTRARHLMDGDFDTLVAPVDLNLGLISLQRIVAPAGLKIATRNEEVVLYIDSGLVECRDDTFACTAVENDMVLLGPSRIFAISGPDAVVYRFGAPSEHGAETQHIPFSSVNRDPKRRQDFGDSEKGSMRRVWHYLGAEDRCTRLMMGRCEGVPGGWTAWPPHEHTQEREELYVYRGMNGSFGIQCVYEDMADPLGVFIVKEGHAVSIPAGYHPNCGAPAGGISYIYCMAAKTPGDRAFFDLRVQPEYHEHFG